MCLRLPEATAREQQHVKFTVRGKSFAYYLDDHHGDGRVAINVKAAPGQQQALIAAYPERFFMPSYLGPKGWLGLYLDAGVIDWDEVESLLIDSYRMIAPKRLAALVP
ncbi:MAG: MmcQ/YjbR family DNA-binding protein [Dehalococcoidia bacterium]